MGNCSKGQDRVDENMQVSSKRPQQLHTSNSAVTGNEHVNETLMTSSATLSFTDCESVMYQSTKDEKGPTKDDFIILKVVGRGSFGKVYMVKNKVDGGIFAMKTLKKDFIIKTKQVANTKTERDIMTLINHPFVVKLHSSFQSSDTLYFVTDFLNGGELFFHLCNEIRFSEERAKFYAAELVLALEHLH